MIKVQKHSDSERCCTVCLCIPLLCLWISNSKLILWKSALQKPRLAHVVSKYSLFYGTRIFITVFTRARNPFISWAKWIHFTLSYLKTIKRTPWPGSASELYRPSDCRLSEKLVPTFADWGCHVVSVTDPYGRILGFIDWSRYFFFQVASQLYSRGWVDPVLDPLLLRKSGSSGNRTMTSGSVARNSDH
jgi:hypothetical protein